MNFLRRLSCSKLILIIASLACATLSSGAGFEEAFQAFHQQRYQEAAEIWRELYKAGNPYAGFNLAYLSYKFSKVNDSGKTIDILDSISRDVKRAKHLKALFLLREGNLESFNKAIDILLTIAPEFHVFRGHSLSVGIKMRKSGPIFYPKKYVALVARMRKVPPTHIVLPIDVLMETSLGVYGEEGKFLSSGKGLSSRNFVTNTMLEHYSERGSDHAKCLSLGRKLQDESIGLFNAIGYKLGNKISLESEDIDSISKCAKAGWGAYQNILGLYTYHKSKAESIDWFKKAAANGSAEAMYHYYSRSRIGLFPMLTKNEALLLNDMAIRSLNASPKAGLAAYQITTLNWLNWTGEPTSVEAIRHYMKLARIDWADAENSMARVYFTLSEGTHPDYERLVRIFDLKNWLQENYDMGLPGSGSYLCSYYIRKEFQLSKMPNKLEKLCERSAREKSSDLARVTYAVYLHANNKFKEAFIWAYVVERSRAAKIYKLEAGFVKNDIKNRVSDRQFNIFLNKAELFNSRLNKAHSSKS